MKVEEKLGYDKFRVDAGHPHMSIDKELCRRCVTRPCLTICPVENFTLDERGEVVMSWEGCVECGAVLVACHQYGNKGLTWEYPRGGYGIVYRGGQP